MKTVFAACAVLASISAPAIAQENYVSTDVANDLARNLGEIVGSESGCGFTLDTGALTFIISDLIPPDNTEFARNLQLRSQVTGYQFDTMSAAAKMAWCTQIRRLGEKYKLVK